MVPLLRAQPSGASIKDNGKENPDPASMRSDYSLPGAGLSESDAHPDPLHQFDQWYEVLPDVRWRRPVVLCNFTATISFGYIMVIDSIAQILWQVLAS